MPASTSATMPQTTTLRHTAEVPAALLGITHRYDSTRGDAAPALRDFSLTLKPG